MIKIYMVRADAFWQQDLFLQGCRQLDCERLAKVNACRSVEDKARSLCCGLLLQDVLRRYEGTCERLEIRYSYGKYGKPYLKDYPALHIGLSHSGAFAVLAVSDEEVGIDVQMVRPLRDGVIRRTLSRTEYKRYEQMPTPQEKQDWFFRCWCAKESYAKLTGKGLLGEFRAITLTAGGRQIVPGAVCREYRCGDACYMNVCVWEMGGDPGFPENVVDVTERLCTLPGMC